MGRWEGKWGLLGEQAGIWAIFGAQFLLKKCAVFVCKLLLTFIRFFDECKWDI